MPRKRTLVVAMLAICGLSAAASERELESEPMIERSALAAAHRDAITGEFVLTPRKIEAVADGFEKLTRDPNAGLMTLYMSQLVRQQVGSYVGNLLGAAMGALPPGASLALGLVQNLTGQNLDPASRVEQAIAGGDFDMNKRAQSFFDGVSLDELPVALQQMSLGHAALVAAGDADIALLDEARLDEILAANVDAQVLDDPALRRRARDNMRRSALLLAPYRQRIEAVFPDMVERPVEYSPEKIARTLAILREDSAVRLAAAKGMQRKAMSAQVAGAVAGRLAPARLGNLASAGGNAAAVSALLAGSSSLNDQILALPAKHGMVDSEYYAIRDRLRAGHDALRAADGEAIDREDILLSLGIFSDDPALIEAEIEQAKAFARPYRRELDELFGN